MNGRLAIIGFGEAGMAFAGAGSWGDARAGFDAAGFDIAGGKHADFAAAGVRSCATAGEALAGAETVLCLVTADAALAAARAAESHLAPGALWCDMNSVAPATKRDAAAVVGSAGGRYVDVAIMAPVHPGALAVPLLIAGPDAAAGDAALAGLGFSNRKVLAGGVGAAATVKMLRSVIIKGQEALTAECLLAATRAGLVDEVLLALGAGWAARGDYHLDRMMVHGARRAAEIDEVVATLVGLGVEPVMARGTAQVQRRSARGCAPAGLAAKLAVLA